MKYVSIFLVALFFAIPELSARSHRCSPPPPRRYHHHYYHHYREPSGLRTAAEIVGLVGVSAATLGALAAPAISRPVIVEQPVVVSQPAPQPTVVVQQPAPPQPRSVTIMPDGTRIEKF